MFRQLPLLLVLAFISISPCFADAGTMKLEDMIQRSQYIVLGKVSAVKVVDGVKLAQIEVTRTLKGDPGITRLYYWASPSWVCDVSDAKVLEEGIYFLWYPEVSKPSKEYLRLLKRAHPFLQGATVADLVHSGRGRLRPRYIDSERYLYVHKYSDVIFPVSIGIVRRSPEDPDFGLVRLDDVLSFITNQVRGNAQHNKALQLTAR
ncbi:MAG: hypothetical protein ACREBG_09635 [Pyrinomonadaceae bacterium]